MNLRARTARVPRSVVLAAATLLVMAGAGVAAAEAATPCAGTVSSTSPSAHWTGGPFGVSNTTATTGALACNAAPCDGGKSLFAADDTVTTASRTTN